MEGDKKITFSQAQSYAVLALKKMIENGGLRGSTDDILRGIDYTMHEIASDDGIQPKQVEMLVRNLDIIPGYGPAKVFQYDYAGDCKDWIVAFTRAQADRIFSEFVPEESPESVTEMTREEYWSSRAAESRVTEETVEHCFLNAPCHLSTTEV